MCVESANIDKSSNENLFNLSESTKLKNSDIFKNLDDKLKHLPSSQYKDLKQILTEYKELFPDVSSWTDMIYHDVDIVNDASPIKQHPYRLSPAKQKFLKEVEYLLENDLIEPTRSNWSSPCVLVPKQDGSYCMCTDYRKVNNVTKSNTYPKSRMGDCIDRIGNAQCMTKFDLLKGFW